MKTFAYLDTHPDTQNFETPPIMAALLREFACFPASGDSLPGKRRRGSGLRDQESWANNNSRDLARKAGSALASGCTIPT